MNLVGYGKALDTLLPSTRVVLRRDRSDFRGEVGRLGLGPLTLIRAYASRRLRWDRSGHADASEPPYYMVRFQLYGDMAQTVLGQTTKTARGSIVVMDSRIAISGVILGEAEHMAVKVPAWFMQSTIPWIDRCCAASFDAERGSGKALAELIRTAWYELAGLSEHDHEILPGCLLRLLEAGLLSNRLHESPAPLPRPSRYQRIQQLIREHAADPDFCPDVVCDQLGISRSTLYEATREAGTTFNALLWQERLEQVKRRLTDSACTSMTLTDLALSHGFQDLSHFSRRFKETYGVSPHQFRRTASPVLEAP